MDTKTSDAVQSARNETAYFIGWVCALFLVCGVAHLYMGKTKQGLIWMFVKGPLNYLLVLVVSITVIGIIWSLPYVLRVIQRQAAEGAAIV